MGRITYTLENNNDVITLNNIVAADFFKGAGARGFGIAPTALTLRDGAGAGSVWRNTRRTTRYVDLPLVIFGKTGQEIEDKMRRLTRLMNDQFTSGKIVANYPDGTRWSSEFHFSGGGDPQFGTDDTDGRTFAKWPITIACPDPYFTSETLTVLPPIKAANSGRGLVRTGAGGLSRLRISSSQTIGVLSVVNTGDVDAWPIWEVKGPGDSFNATRQADAALLPYPVPIASSDTITFDTRPKIKTVKDQTGANKYGNLGVAPRLFSIPSGTSVVSVVMPGTTSVSQITLSFYPRRELVFG